MCLVGGEGVGEERTSEERRLNGKPPKNASSEKTTGSQCAEGRVGPLCNKCGPFGKYLQVKVQKMKLNYLRLLCEIESNTITTH